MAYATLAEFKSYLGSRVSPAGMYQKLTSRSGGTAGDDVVGQELLDGAQAELNTWLSGRYRTPIVTSDGELVRWLKESALVIARFKAYQPPAAMEMPKVVSDEYQNLISLLKRIADGSTSLAGAEVLAVPVSSGGGAIVFGSTPVFTDNGL